jgi:hydrogenase maturation protease
MKTAIVGIGNSLMRDEGVGVHVAQALTEAHLPSGVVVIDGGTDPDVVYSLDGFDRVIVIDAMRGGERPGTVYRLGGDVEFEDAGRRACHDVGLLEILRAVRSDGEVPEVVVVGIEPDEIDWGMELSPAVRASIPRVVEVVQGAVSQKSWRS